ncbi:superinfection immunity protein [Novosphingobium sp. 32-60-15]|uniref:superinfection immunity protein n=1 Tax=Novosphingobium sp. 32-60-15 TaxID=1970410 RepID=UPI00344CCAF9
MLPLSFLPSIIAFKRSHVQKWFVLLLNVLTGWTGIGWIAAFIWACVGKPEPKELRS